ncbi:hypothetical protein [Bacillus pseudomycoides]|uniref:hypothetical protein n=1 Tax=Bacillus pseudomycoides TaxID=64104 RepID=UPI00211D7686|nr:hypothetical protein [Bacillus pseudomycoides]
MAKPKAIQIPLSEKMRQRCPELFVWIESQENPNEATRKVLDHFISLYGTQSVDSEEVKLGMAKDLLSAKGMLQGDIQKGVHSLGSLTYKQSKEVTPIEMMKSAIEVTNKKSESENIPVGKAEEKVEDEPMKRPIQRNMNIEKWTNQ